MFTESHRNLDESMTGDNEAVDTEGDNNNEVPAQMSFFDKWLSVWVVLCMVIGGAIGALAPASADTLAQATFAQINAISAVLLWAMILPMLMQIDFESIKAVRKVPGAIALTTCVNYLVKPFTMCVLLNYFTYVSLKFVILHSCTHRYGLAILFFRVFYVSIIPDEVYRNEIIAGLILLAAAPCTAMVFVWCVIYLYIAYNWIYISLYCNLLFVYTGHP